VFLGTGLYEAQCFRAPDHENSGDLRFRRQVNEHCDFLGFVGSANPREAAMLLQSDKKLCNLGDSEWILDCYGTLKFLHIFAGIYGFLLLLVSLLTAPPRTAPTHARNCTPPPPRIAHSTRRSKTPEHPLKRLDLGG
jgi:hypothetical protein